MPLAIYFHPESDRSPELADAVREYRRIWERERARIVDRLQELTGLHFAETVVHAIVHEGPSHSHPLCLRASYPTETKQGTLIHELSHRLISGNRRRLGLPAPRDLQEETHRLINLFLFDAWVDLYGEDFARDQVSVESGRQPFYASAWEWSLAMDRGARAVTLKRELTASG